MWGIYTMSFFKQDIEKDIEKEKKLQARIKDNAKLLKQKEELLEQKKITKNTYNAIKPKGFWKRFFDIRGRIKRIQDYFRPEHTLLINMELRNGFHRLFMVSIKGNKFKYDNGTYVIDDEFKYYDLGARTYCLDYHQDLSFPIRRKIDINKIKALVSQEGITDVDTAINPLTLKQFIESEVIQKVMRGADMDQVFKFLKAVLIYVAIITTTMLLLYIQSSGI
ncbi:unnamed protein product, partial [marine sediment metagenome]